MRLADVESLQNAISRRGFLGGMAAGATSLFGVGAALHSATAKTTAQQKQVVLFWMDGGVSQLESWDPKPRTEFGGPFSTIPTSVPGLHISELLPHTARQMHQLALIRSMKTGVDDHTVATRLMQTGHPPVPGFDSPYLGSALSSLLAAPERALPPYFSIGHSVNGLYDDPAQSAFLGAQNGAVVVDNHWAEGVTNIDKAALERLARRRKLRRDVEARFSGRGKANVEAYAASFDQAATLLDHRSVFALPDKELERYGKHDFARQCLLARHLLEAGATFVKVSHTNYDTHANNFDFHVEQLGEFDRPFATFIADLAERGRLEHTLVICMGEFGRTPSINAKLGRDHWPTAWSLALCGCGIHKGAVVGKTNETGTDVVAREVGVGHLFHTIYRAVGLDPTDDFYYQGRAIPKADPKATAIQELLA